MEENCHAKSVHAGEVLRKRDTISKGKRCAFDVKEKTSNADRAKKTQGANLNLTLNEYTNDSYFKGKRDNFSRKYNLCAKKLVLK